VKKEAKAFLQIYCSENDLSDLYSQRWPQIESEIERTGRYWQTPEELAFGAKTAWRNSTRCIGRLHWQNLVIRDCRALSSAEEIFSALVDHIGLSTSRGAIVPMISIFAPKHGEEHPVRIWNRQLIEYAGHPQRDGSVLGDPLNAEFTEAVYRLGWTREQPGRFDLLPVVIETPQELRCFDWPAGLILEVPIRHPHHSWFQELQLKWYALPAVSGMRLEIGGVSYPAAPFSGWYVGTEVGARDLADVHRYNLLPVIANRLGLNTTSDRTLWKDHALVELNVAVLNSFAQAGVTMIDHHTAARQFQVHEERETKAGRRIYADWSWIVPPLSGATTPIFHRTFQNTAVSPNFYPQVPPWRSGRVINQPIPKAPSRDPKL
jgi:nitric-oxide synthase